MKHQLDKQGLVLGMWRTALHTMIPLCMIIIGSSTLHAQAGSVRCDRPGAGEHCAAGSGYDITWSSTLDSGTVRILLWNGMDGSWSTIAVGIDAAQQSYHWIIDSTMLGDLFRIRIENEEGADNAMTESYFVIQEPVMDEEFLPRLAVLPPAVHGDSRFVMLVTPNPTTSLVDVRAEGLVLSSVTLRDVLGNEVNGVDISVKSGDHVMIRVDQLPNGIYFIDASVNDGRRVMGKFVIQR